MPPITSGFILLFLFLCDVKTISPVQNVDEQNNQGPKQGPINRAREVNAVMIPNGQKDQTKTNIGRFAGLLDR